MNQMGVLEVWLESANGHRTPVRGSCFLGRAPSCEVVLANGKVSRQHALVNRQSEGEFWLIDLGSVNGTYIVGRGRVGRDQLYKLRDRDELVLGGAKLEFRRN